MEIDRDGIIYNIYNSTATVEGVTIATTKHITIPNIIDGCVVQEIADNAFFGLNILSVVIPDSLKQIGPRAFAMCAELKSVKCNLSSMKKKSRVPRLTPSLSRG